MSPRRASIESGYELSDPFDFPHVGLIASSAEQLVGLLAQQGLAAVQQPDSSKSESVIAYLFQLEGQAWTHFLNQGNTDDLWPRLAQELDATILQLFSEEVGGWRWFLAQHGAYSTR